MCSKVMSVWVLVSTSCDSDGGVNILVRGVLLSTWTTMGSLAVLKASTAWSWVALDKSLPLTCRTHFGWDRIIIKQKLVRVWAASRKSNLEKSENFDFVCVRIPKACLVWRGWVWRCTDLALTDKPRSRRSCLPTRMSVTQFHHLLILPVRGKSSPRLRASIRE